MSWKISATVCALVLSVGAAQAQDLKKGERAFKKCKACHEVGADAKQKTGPILNGIVGRAAGSIEGFDYSKALVAAADGGLIWTEEELDKFLTKPKEYLPKTKMSFAGLRKETDRVNIIAYLATFTE